MINAQYREVDKREIAIDDRELSARLGREVSHTDPEISVVCDTVIRTAEPRYAYTRVAINRTEDGRLDLGFATVESHALAKNLVGCREAFLLVLTLGAELDRLVTRLGKTSRAEAYIYDAVASAVTEAAMDAAERQMRGTLACAVRFSPGYADLALTCQGAFLDYLGAPTYLGVTLGESLLMTPLKTVTAIVGIKENEEEKSEKTDT